MTAPLRLWSAVAFLLALATALQFSGVVPLLRYSRDAVAAGEIWRLVTGNLVHLGVAHLAMNALGTVLVAALVGSHLRPLGWAVTWVLASLAVGLGLWWGQPDIDWYVGLSGTLHGLVVAGALAALRDPRERLFAAVVLVAIAAKLAWEFSSGSMPGTAALAGGPVVTAAHLYGAIGGLVAGGVALIGRTVFLASGHRSG